MVGMKRWRFQFSLPGLLGLTTCVAIMLAAVQHELGVVALAGVYITLTVFISTLFSLALLRDCWTATWQRSLAPFKIIATKGGAIAFGMVLVMCVGGLYWSFGAPAHEGLEELVGKQWSEACRKGASALGVGLALLHVRHRDFWVYNDAAKVKTLAADKSVVLIAADEIVE